MDNDAGTIKEHRPSGIYSKADFTIAEDFATWLDDNRATRREYLRGNRQKFVWHQSPFSQSEPANFWTYGLEIPGAGGLLYMLAEAYYIKCAHCNHLVWHTQLRGGPALALDCENFDEVRKVVEDKWKSKLSQPSISEPAT